MKSILDPTVLRNKKKAFTDVLLDFLTSTQCRLTFYSQQHPTVMYPLNDDKDYEDSSTKKEIRTSYKKLPAL